MRHDDLLSLALESLRLHRLRTALTVSGILIGVTAVILLTTLGEAAMEYVTDQFSGIGTDLVMITPGRTETQGFAGATLGSVRNLTLEDVAALERQAPAVLRVAPLSMGTATFEWAGRSRDVRVIGSTADYARVRNMTLLTGRFLPPGDPRHGEAVAVIGRTVAREVFGSDAPLGQPVRIGRWRFRVIGVLESKGTSFGMNIDDAVVIPVGTALRMFDQPGLFRIVLKANDSPSVARAVEQARAVLMRRHDGEEDFTIVTQQAMLQTFRAVLDALTAALAGIAAISLAVAGIGIMNVMLVSVSERTGEVGLLKALGARRGQIQRLFLTEAVLLSAGGALAGIALGVAIVLVAAGIWPDLPLRPSVRWIGVVTVLALAAGLAFGVMPARRASRLPAADALRGRV